MTIEVAEGTESRVMDFAELVATAIANTETRRELERVAAEQRALRRAATLVASGASPMEVFSAITTFASELFEVPFASLLRYGPDQTATMIAGCAACSGFVGQTWTVPADDPGIVRTVVESLRPARIEDHSGVHGPLGQAAHSLGIGSVVGVPVIVDGSVWGVLAVGAAEDGPPLPADAGDRLVGFTELVTTTLVNAETRDSIRRLADEQAALRRVATLVAAGVEPDELFAAVSEEVAQLFTVDGAGIGRFEPDGSGVVVVGRSESLRSIPVGSRQDLDKSLFAGEVYRTGRAVRIDVKRDAVADPDALGEIARQVLALGFSSTVAAPIVVEGDLWGVVTASSSHATLPPDTEKRVESFCELVATAIANAESRGELAASEARARELAARIVAAGDEARRRIERNLHDGTQQRLVSLGLDVETVRESIPADQHEAQSGLERIRHELEAVLEDVRELSHGLHPALLSQAGLGPALRALARRSPIPVKLGVSVSERPTESTETAVYYVVSEALANAAKHAGASEISVVLTTSGNEIRAVIEDDGSGGAEASAGSGLVGLIDRIEALGGRLVLDSPPGRGTRISIEMPLTAEPIVDVARVSSGGGSAPDDASGS